MFRKRWTPKNFLLKFNRESRYLSGERPIQVYVSSVMNKELAWAREETVGYLQKMPGFIPWAFEYTPASSENIQEGYLSKVRESDFVIWLIGSTTTEPVKLEIREALSADRRILAFKLPVDSRDHETQNLINEVGQRVKWVEVANKQELIDALEGSIFDELIRAIRGKPGLGRIARYEEMQRASRGRCFARWQAAGTSLADALSLYEDLAIGMPPPNIVQKPLVILLGDFGAGKSLIAERIYQIGINKAMQDSSAPIPVFLRAQQISGNLDKKVIEMSDGLGNPKHQGALIVIDGADEAGISASSQILEMARILSQTWPKTSVLITSRPLPIFTDTEEKIDVPSLDINDVMKIASKIAGYEITHGMISGLPRPISDAITRPLFALLWGNYMRQNANGAIKTTGELISHLVENSIKLTDEGIAKSIELLEKLAASSMDTGGSYIHWGEIGTRENVDKLLESRLVERRGDLIGFPLPILTQWFAAQGLVKGKPDISDIVKNLSRLDRWRYPLMILLSTYSHEQVTKVLTPIVKCNPGFAAEILTKAIARYGFNEDMVLPLARECAERVRTTIRIWIGGIGNLSNYIAPVNRDGSLQTTGVNVFINHLLIAWYRGEKKLDDIVELPPGLIGNDPEWYTARSAQVGTQPGWAWLWSLDNLVGKLDHLLERRGFMIEGGHIYREKIWQIALRVMGYGDLHQDPLPLDVLEDRLSRIINLDKVDVYTEFHVLKTFLLKMKGEGKEYIEFPWPGPDKELLRGGWLWEEYSDEQLLNRVRKVYSACLEEYEGLVNTFFSKLKPRLETATLLPAILVGEIYFSSSSVFGRSPSFNSYFDPQLERTKSSVQISLGEERQLIDIDKLYERNRRMRPHAAEWISASIGGNSLTDIFHTDPVTRIVYYWLKRDLKRINWTNLI